MPTTSRAFHHLPCLTPTYPRISFKSGLSTANELAIMPLAMAPESPQIPAMQPSFPANFKQAASMIGGILTDVTSTTFSDKIMITITQDGRLAHWVLL